MTLSPTSAPCNESGLEGSLKDPQATPSMGDKETMKSAWAEIAEELAKNEKKKIHEAGREKGREEGREEGIGYGLRQAIDNVALSRFHKRSRRLNADVERVSDFGQLNSILSYAAAQATSINDVIAYVGALQ